MMRCMGRSELEHCTFETARLNVAPWHSLDEHSCDSLAEIVADMLTKNSTSALPEPWRGDYSIERAHAFLTERDLESPTLLAVDRNTGAAIALLIVVEVPLGDAMVDVRIGYVVAESAWGRGFATEMLAGLIEWAETQPAIATLTGGVDSANQASAQVLAKNGFSRIAGSEAEGWTYQLEVGTTGSTPQRNA